MQFTARAHSFELFGPPGGLSDVLFEAQRIIAAPWKPHKFAAQPELMRGFVRVRNASWDQACELAARLSSVHDVRLALLDTSIRGWSDLERELERVSWTAFMPVNESVVVHAEAGEGVCAHAGKLKRSAESVLASFGFAIAATEPCTRLDLMTHAQTLRVRLSLGGDALHKRGWRAVTSSLATLREDVACAALLRLATFEPRVWDATHISVPFAGSGTLGVEAWHALYGLPPSVWGLERSWQRLMWPSQASRTWWRNRINRAAQETRLPPITLIERDVRQSQELRANMRHVQETLEPHGVVVPVPDVLGADVFSLPIEHIVPRAQVTLMPLHPPYGLRLSPSGDMQALYDRLGRSVVQWGNTARASNGALIGFCLCPSEPLWRVFRSHLGEAHLGTSHLTQGGLDVRLCAFSFAALVAGG